MNIPTGEFRALSAQAARVGEYHRRETFLIEVLAILAGEESEQRVRPSAPVQLRLIKGDLS